MGWNLSVEITVGVLVMAQRVAANHARKWRLAHDLAEEMRSTALESLVLAAQSYEGAGQAPEHTFPQFAALVIRSDLIDSSEKHTRRARFWVPPPSRDEPDNEPLLVDDSSSPEEDAMWKERIDALPSLDRAIVMRLLEGYTQQEVADQLGITFDRLIYRLHRIREPKE